MVADPTWPDVLSTLLRGEALSTHHTSWVMSQVVRGDATPAQVAGFAMALRAKGETATEVRGMVEAMLAHAVPVAVSPDAVDVVGTGGDRLNTVNISTMAAIVVAAAGVKVVKHGNRAASSTCGSADLLEALGVAIDLGPEGVARCVETAGIGFCFAGLFHAGMRHAAVPRRELGVPTVFNFLGPLTNPGQPRAGAIGCADTRMAGVLADVLAERGGSALVMRGEDGLDEFSVVAPTALWTVREGTVRQTTLDALDLGIARSSHDDIRGADATFNSGAAKAVFAGERGSVRDAVVLNAAAALVAYDGPAVDDAGLVTALGRGLTRAREAIDSGLAANTLGRWIETSQASRSA